MKWEKCARASGGLLLKDICLVLCVAYEVGEVCSGSGVLLLKDISYMLGSVCSI